MQAPASRRQWSNMCSSFADRVMHALAGAQRPRYVWDDAAVEDVEIELEVGAHSGPQHEFLGISAEALWLATARLNLPDGLPRLRLVICMDNDAMVRMVNGECRIDDPIIAPAMHALQNLLGSWHSTSCLCPWHPCLPFARHVDREQNTVADGLCNEALDSNRDGVHWAAVLPRLSSCDAILLHVDGASRGNPGACSAGAVLSVRAAGMWIAVASASRLLGWGTSGFAECSSLRLGLELVDAFLSGYLTVD